MLGVVGEVGLLLSDGRLVVKDQDSPLAGLEPGDPSSATLLVTLLSDESLQGVTDNIPELVVLVTEQDDGSADLVIAARKRNDRGNKHGVIEQVVTACSTFDLQRGRSVEDGLLDDVFNSRVCNGSSL